MIHWANDLFQKLEFWISFDITNEYNSVTRVRQGFVDHGLEEGIHFNIHQYCEADMIKQYPELALLKKEDIKINLVNEFKSPLNYSLAWGFHNEAINIWFQIHNRFKFVWVVEDDVGYAGNILNFVEHYESNTDDLISHGSKSVDGWFWAETVSKKFADLIPIRKRVKVFEHVQRFSRQLLENIHLLGLEGIVGWSEASTPTLCDYLELKRGHLKKDHIGKEYSWDGRMSYDEWHHLLTKSSKRGTNKLYHALKF